MPARRIDPAHRMTPTERSRRRHDRMKARIAELEAALADAKRGLQVAIARVPPEDRKRIADTLRALTDVAP